MTDLYFEAKKGMSTTGEASNGSTWQIQQTDSFLSVGRGCGIIFGRQQKQGAGESSLYPGLRTSGKYECLHLTNAIEDLRGVDLECLNTTCTPAHIWSSKPILIQGSCFLLRWITCVWNTSSQQLGCQMPGMMTSISSAIKRRLK